MRLIAQLQRLERSTRFHKRLIATWRRNVTIETRTDRTEHRIRRNTPIFGHVNDSRTLERRFVRASTNLRNRNRGHWTIRSRIDLEKISVLLARESFRDFFTRDPRVRPANATGAVRRSPAKDRKVTHHLVVVDGPRAQRLKGPQGCKRPAENCAGFDEVASVH
jgi:hypothetical protein